MKIFNFECYALMVVHHDSEPECIGFYLKHEDAEHAAIDDRVLRAVWRRHPVQHVIIPITPEMSFQFGLPFAEYELNGLVKLMLADGKGTAVTQ